MILMLRLIIKKRDVIDFQFKSFIKRLTRGGFRMTCESLRYDMEKRTIWVLFLV